MPSFVGLLTVKLYLPDGRTLKDKRQVLQSVLNRISHRYNVSVAEVGLNDHRSNAELAIACVANESTHVHRVLDGVLRAIRSEPRAVVEDDSIEML
jgi:uncharacterized protein YlxP (DUF503 family)